MSLFCMMICFSLNKSHCVNDYTCDKALYWVRQGPTPYSLLQVRFCYFSSLITLHSNQFVKLQEKKKTTPVFHWKWIELILWLRSIDIFVILHLPLHELVMPQTFNYFSMFPPCISLGRFSFICWYNYYLFCFNKCIRVTLVGNNTQGSGVHLRNMMSTDLCVLAHGV